MVTIHKKTFKKLKAIVQKDILFVSILDKKSDEQMCRQGGTSNCCRAEHRHIWKT